MHGSHARTCHFPGRCSATFNCCTIICVWVVRSCCIDRGAGTTPSSIGLKLERKRTKTCIMIFISNYLVEIGNELKTLKMKYERGNHWGRIHSGYMTFTIGNKHLLEHKNGLIPWPVHQKAHSNKFAIRPGISHNSARIIKH